MVNERVFERLKRDRLFSHLKESQILQIVGGGEIVKLYSHESVLYEKSRKADFWYIPLRGEICNLLWNPNGLLEESELPVSKFAGLHEVISQGRYLNDALTVMDTSGVSLLLKFPFGSFGSQESGLDVIVKKELIKDCRQLWDMLELHLHSSYDTFSKLVAYFVQEVRLNSDKGKNPYHIQQSHDYIASNINAGREVVTRRLNHLKLQGIIELNIKNIEILNYNKLLEMYKESQLHFCYPKIVETMAVEELAKIYCEMHERLETVMPKLVGQRLRRYFNQQAAYYVRLNQSPRITATHRQIGDYICASREEVSRKIEQLRRSGALQNDGTRKVIFMDAKKVDDVLREK
ncbi:helix-turn-helix domain-containing protein [Candidatus Woesearchaeota archaeon]|nr:helix-turn-helix domain-containing protein [Candidatus Woesearchaeota archaeon]